MDIEKTRIGVSDLALIVAFYLCVDLVVVFLLKKYWQEVTSDYLLLISGLEFALTIGFALVRHPNLLQRSRWRVNKADVLTACAAAIGTRFASHLLFPDFHASIRTTIGVALVLLLMPFLEEVLFRGIFLRVLAERFPRATTAVVVGVSLAVAALHISFWNAVILHVVLATVYLLRGNSLGASITCHILMNALTFTPLG